MQKVNGIELEPELPNTRVPNFIERLWAYLTIEKLLNDKADNGGLNKDVRDEVATEIALKYNFVTKLTSLVVVKPNVTSEQKIQDELIDLTPVDGICERTDGRCWNQKNQIPTNFRKPRKQRKKGHQSKE